MTRKTALVTAISVLDRTTAEDISEVKQKLQDIVDDLPKTNWSKETILDAVEQYRQDHGRYPSIKEFEQKGLPTKRIVEKVFGQSIELVLSEYFPELQLRRKASRKFRDEQEYWLSFFVEYVKIHPETTNITYNQERPAGSPSWQMIAAMYHLKRWNDLLKWCQLPICRKDEEDVSGI